MQQDLHSYDPAEGHRLRFDPLKAIIAPRPIGWISTADEDGVANLAPYSFFNAFSNIPPILGFASQGRKDSLKNIEQTGEFVFNLSTLAQAQAMNLSCLPLDPDVDEFSVAGLNKLPSEVVRPPRVAGSPVTMECKVTTIHPLVNLEGAEIGAVLILGQVVRMHIDKAYLHDGLFDTARAKPLARCGYLSDYAVLDSLYKLDRPEMVEEAVLESARQR